MRILKRTQAYLSNRKYFADAQCLGKFNAFQYQKRLFVRSSFRSPGDVIPVKNDLAVSRKGWAPSDSRKFTQSLFFSLVAEIPCQTSHWWGKGAATVLAQGLFQSPVSQSVLFPAQGAWDRQACHKHPHKVKLGRPEGTIGIIWCDILNNTGHRNLPSNLGIQLHLSQPAEAWTYLLPLDLPSIVVPGRRTPCYEKFPS